MYWNEQFLSFSSPLNKKIGTENIWATIWQEIFWIPYNFGGSEKYFDRIYFSLFLSTTKQTSGSWFYFVNNKYYQHLKEKNNDRRKHFPHKYFLTTIWTILFFLLSTLEWNVCDDAVGSQLIKWRIRYPLSYDNYIYFSCVYRLPRMIVWPPTTEFLEKSEIIKYIRGNINFVMEILN